jgi:hypothetical protein
MASTRNRNTRGDYALEQDAINQSRSYNNYLHAAQGCAFKPSMPSFGLIPSHMPRHTLSKNPIEIESFLFGINSTNLVAPQKPIKPQLKRIPTSVFFERLPIHMPKPLVVEHNQRPYPI